MLSDYLPILITLLIASGVAAGVIAISHLLGPKRPTTAKLAPYESGMVPIGMAWRRFPIKFYLTAMLFVIFDIEIIFFYPWAVILRQMKGAGLAMFALVEMGIFALLLLLGYIYVLKKGALEWE
jgi:NADH-quinone oxidoreductase subunit A